MKEKELLVTQRKKLKAQRRFQNKLRTQAPLEFLGIVIHGALDRGFRLDHSDSTSWLGSLEILSYQVTLRNRTQKWLKVLSQGIDRITALTGKSPQGINLVSDLNHQHTSRSFLEFWRKKGIDQILTIFNNPKGNADTKRVIRTIKEEVIWINEFARLDEAKEAIAQFVDFYNNFYCHSSLDYRIPRECFDRWWEEQKRKVA